MTQIHAPACGAGRLERMVDDIADVTCEDCLALTASPQRDVGLREAAITAVCTEMQCVNDSPNPLSWKEIGARYVDAVLATLAPIEGEEIS